MRNSSYASSYERSPNVAPGGDGDGQPKPPAGQAGTSTTSGYDGYGELRAYACLN